MTEQKKLKIRQSLAKTRLKRSSQQCHVYKVKIQYNKLNKLQKQQLKMLFVQGKWLYNHLLNLSKQQNLFKINPTNIKSILHYDKDGNQINSQLTIAAKHKQSIFSQIKSNITILSTLKKHKLKIGKLNFINQFKSLNLEQLNNSYKINKLKTKIHIAGIKGYIKVNGLDQIKDNYEIANAKLLNKPDGYYIAITTFRNKQIRDNNTKPNIGIDFGCSTSFTLSNGQKYDNFIEETERLKALQRKLALKKKNSNNKRKLISKIRKQYQKLSNRKLDKANKFVHYLKQNFNQIHIQDEQIALWMQNKHGRSIQHDILGRVKSKLKELNKVVVINKYIATTKICSKCNHVQQINLYQRIYKCPICGLQIDRDINSAMNILNSSPMDNRLNACNTRSSI